MDFTEFQSRTIGIQISQMNSVTVTEACGIKQRAIIINSSRTPDNLILPITVNIGNRQVMISIAKHGVTPAATSGLWGCHLCRLLHIGINHRPLGVGIRAVQPAMLQLRTIKIHSPDISISIVSSTEDATGIGIRTTQIGYGSQIAVSSVIAVIVRLTYRPVERTSSLTQLSFRITVGIIGYGMYSLSCHSIKYG